MEEHQLGSALVMECHQADLTTITRVVPQKDRTRGVDRGQQEDFVDPIAVALHQGLLIIEIGADHASLQELVSGR